MATVPPPSAQAPPPQPAVTAQATPTAVVREPSTELLRLAAGTRVEGTVQPPPPPAQADAARAAVQTLQNAVDANKQDVRVENLRTDATRADASRAATPAPSGTTAPPGQSTTQPPPQQQPPAVQIRTPIGDVTLRTPLPLPEGARVAFDIASNNSSQVTVRLTSLNGQPIQQALVQLAADRAATPPQNKPLPAQGLGRAASAGALAFGQAWTPTGAVQLTQASSVNAFVLNGTTPTNAAQPPAGTQTPGIQTTLFSGSDLTVRITNVTAGQVGAQTPNASAQTNVLTQTATQPGSGAQIAGTATPTPANTAGTPNQATPQGSTQTTAQVQPPGTTTPAGGSSQSGLRLVSAQGWPSPPFTTPTQTQGSPVQLALSGTVTGQSTTAQPTIQTAAGTVQLASPANLPAGTIVSLEVLSQTPGRTDAAGGAAAPRPSTGTLPFAAGTAPWPTLTEALQVLQRSDPQAAQQLANTLPDGGPRTVAAALSFIQSMRGGDQRQWPGDNNLRALERTGPRGAHLAKTLSGEVAQLSAQTRETTGEWRTTPIPWNAEGQIEKINVITRREESPEDDENEEEKKTGPGLRFLLDLDLSQLGPLQLDGMVHEETKGFDMMIRSHEPLDEKIRHDLMGLFVATNLAVGLKGGLTFQVTPKFADPIASSEPRKLKRDGVWV